MALPYEAQIRAYMRTYTLEGDADFGKRGFCADGTTLTDYIWRYLGNVPPPFGVTATTGVLKATIGWRVPSVRTAVTGYNVYRKVDGSRVRQGDTVAASTYEKEITGLSAAVEYEFMVQVVEGAKESGPSETVTATPTAGAEESLVTIVPRSVANTAAFAHRLLPWKALTQPTSSTNTEYRVYSDEGRSYVWWRAPSNITNYDSGTRLDIPTILPATSVAGVFGVSDRSGVGVTCTPMGTPEYWSNGQGRRHPLNE